MATQALPRGDGVGVGVLDSLGLLESQMQLAASLQVSLMSPSPRPEAHDLPCYSLASSSGYIVEGHT